jgi:hypothetical protein
MRWQAARVVLVLVVVYVLPSAAQPPESPPETDPKGGVEDDLRPSPTPSPTLMIRGWPDVTLGKLVPEGVKLGVGARAFFERQKSFANTLAHTTVTLRDLERDGTDTTVFDTEPELTNAKFDFELELKGAGIQIPVGLPQIPKTGAVSIYPTLVFELGAVDAAFDVFDTTVPPPAPGVFAAATDGAGAGALAASQQVVSASPRGSGLAFGLGLDVNARVCTFCKWIVSWSYWYRFIPSLDVDRPLGFFPEFDTAFDSLSLRREAHEVSARVGYGASSGARRFVPFTGVLYRKAKLELEDEVRFLEPSIGLETTLESFSQFRSETVQGLVGVDLQLSRSIFGRFETAFGDGDLGVSLQVLWGKRTKLTHEKTSKIAKRREHRASKRSERYSRKVERRFDKLAPALLLRIRAVEAEFQQARKDLEKVAGSGGVVGYRIVDVRVLLSKTTADLSEVLSNPALEPMRDAVVYYNELAQNQLDSAPRSARENPGQLLPTEVRYSRAQPREPRMMLAMDQSLAEVAEAGLVDKALNLFYSVFPFLTTAAESTACSRVNVQFAYPQEVGGHVFKYAPLYSEALDCRWEGMNDCKTCLSSNASRPILRGLYQWCVFHRTDRVLDPELPRCNPELPRGYTDCAFDLAKEPCSKFLCIEDSDPSSPTCCQKGPVDGKIESFCPQANDCSIPEGSRCP